MALRSVVTQTTPIARRAVENPILTPAMVQPSLPELEVVGVFNPAVTRHSGQIVALLRVAESLCEVPAGKVAATTHNEGRLEVHLWDRGDKAVDLSDPRVIVEGGRTWLTSISHLRVARSKDGISFVVEPTPALFPATAYEEFGIEDPALR